MISMYTILDKNGISVSSNMPALSVITTMNSVPSILNMFPDVSRAVNTLQSLLNTYNKTKETLQNAIEEVDKLQKDLDLAKKIYESGVANTPGFYMVPQAPSGTLPTTVGAGVGLYITLNSAYTVLDTAKERLSSLQSKVASLESQVKSQVSSIVDLIFSSQV